jgi:hypothetical protein
VHFVGLFSKYRKMYGIEHVKSRNMFREFRGKKFMFSELRRISGLAEAILVLRKHCAPRC